MAVKRVHETRGIAHRGPAITHDLRIPVGYGAVKMGILFHGDRLPHEKMPHGMAAQNAG